jgi:hypothetical protein
MGFDSFTCKRSNFSYSSISVERTMFEESLDEKVLIRLETG